MELDVQWDLYQNYFCPERNGILNKWAAKGYAGSYRGPSPVHRTPSTLTECVLNVC